MFRKLNSFFQFLIYALFIYIVVIITASFFISNSFISFNIEVLKALLSNIYFLYYFLIIYILIKTFAFIERLFIKKQDVFNIKLETGSIQIKSDTLNNFAKTYLSKNYLIDKSKISSYKSGNKVYMDIKVYTYNVLEISQKLLELQKELQDEIEKTLMLKVSNINIIIENLQESSEVSKIANKTHQEDGQEI